MNLIKDSAQTHYLLNRELTSTQRKELRSAAHHLEPVVQIGKHLITDRLLQQIDESLLAHELIKVKFLEGKDEKRKLSSEIADKTTSTLVGLIGNIAIYFRQHPEENKRKYKIS
jgi:RNA-binding protein